MSEQFYVGLTEVIVNNRDAMPKGMEDWRIFRIEYGGSSEFCVAERYILLPKNANPQELEDLFHKWLKK